MQIETNEVTNKMNDVDANVDIVMPMLNQVVSQYTEHIDQIMANIYTDVVSADNPTTDVIEKYFVQLTNALYFICANTEYLALYDGIAKSAYKESYNNELLAVNSNTDKANKKTVAEATAIAEANALYDQTVSDIYNKAYKIVKAKIESAQTMVSTLSKVLSKRMNEMQLSGMTERRIEE